MNSKLWTKSEIAFIRRHYNQMTCTELGKHLNRTKASVSGKLVKLNLHRTAAARRRLIRSNQFPKGHVPFNKGIYMRHSPATEFKKGHLPINTKYDGCIVTRFHRGSHTPYKYIRIAQGKWQLLHHYVWEKDHGPIPPQHVIRFKNRKTTDCRLSNLLLVSRKKHMCLNHNPVKCGEAMRRHWANGGHLQSDKYIVFALAPSNPELRAIVKNNPALLEMQRLKLRLRRAIYVGTDQKA